MARYIDVDAFIYALEKNILYLNNKYGNDCDVGKTLARVIGEVNGFPSADVQEVKHGKWVFEHETFCGLNVQKCSYCGKQGFRMSNYCPNCGAKMDLKGEEK